MANGFDHQTLSMIWAKGFVVQGYDANTYRKDVCGAWMAWSAYGNRDNQNGWEVDHILPIASGGSNSISNLRPLHWQNNARKSDGSLVCAVSAKG